MFSRLQSTLPFLAVASVAACSVDRATSVPSGIADARAHAAKPARTSDSRARYTVYPTMPDGVTPTLVGGDGRLADGSPSNGAPSVYEGGLCGVHGKIFWYDSFYSQSGDAVFYLASESNVCGTPRKLDIQIPNFGLLSPTMNFREIMQVSNGGSRSHQLNMSVGAGGCSRLQYRADMGSAVKVTRLSGNSTGVPGTWRAESEGTHLAACDITVKGKLQYSGTSHYLPMHMLIEEVR